MRARLYRPGSNDALALDRLFGDNRAGDVRIDRDRLIVGVAGDDSVTSALVWRPAGFVHELHCGTGMARKLAATALTNYAFGDAQSRPFTITQGLFLVDSHNLPMLRFVRELGCTEQKGIVFTLDF